MQHEIDFYYDIVSPYSYFAAIQIARLEAETGASVTWKPIFLGGLFRELGNTAPLSLAPKKRYMTEQDLPRLARHHDVPYQYPTVFPTNTLTVQRTLAALPAADRPSLSLALFDHYWGHGRDVADMALLQQVFTAAALEKANSAEAKNALKSNTDEAIARGAFGAPTLIWQDAIYFGADRIPLLQADLVAAGR
ncbi:2-hydroxychromene-2-carboxylate isomerase [Nitrincola alkalilacustris]|uniref:2-hydroxychromene-2-carboxylate isomerase n=1 Tax=Nitrincola alkalilacustris TaxID=1571224 RepID=UPI00124D096A|nr:2-hydroxychromene-2-carboxylate isomerase [Nitrincola alkalilacustris]